MKFKYKVIEWLITKNAASWGRGIASIVGAFLATHGITGDTVYEVFLGAILLAYSWLGKLIDGDNGSAWMAGVFGSRVRSLAQSTARWAVSVVAGVAAGVGLEIDGSQTLASLFAMLIVFAANRVMAAGDQAKKRITADTFFAERFRAGMVPIEPAPAVQAGYEIPHAQAEAGPDPLAGAPEMEAGSGI